MPLNPQAKLAENIFKKAKRARMSAQDIQDGIFQSMSADRRIEVASGLWRLAKELDSDKIDYGVKNRSNRSSASPR